MDFQDIECCSTTIFSFLDLQELCRLKLGLWNKTMQQSIHFVICQKKSSSVLYQKILEPHFDKDDLEITPIVFFTTLQKYMHTHHDTQFDFKNFLFHIFNTTQHSQFYLATRGHRLYMVKYLRPTELIMFVQPNHHSVYYTRMFSPSPRQPQPEGEDIMDNHIGYIYQHGEYQKDEAFIRSLMNPTIK